LIVSGWASFLPADLMKVSRKVYGSRGFSLLEVTVSLGVLAVAIPLSVAGIAGSVNSDGAARMDSMAASMVTVCLDEWSAARNGEGAFAVESASTAGSEEVWTIGFASTGESLGKVEAEDYRMGSRQRGMMYLASIGNEPVEEGVSARKVRVSVEFPAVARAEQRQRLEFFTRLP
jgi:prepilin-type N-terminal cleavage/methylation domain-containing protein